MIVEIKLKNLSVDFEISDTKLLAIVKEKYSTTWKHLPEAMMPKIKKEVFQELKEAVEKKLENSFVCAVIQLTLEQGKWR